MLLSLLWYLRYQTRKNMPQPFFASFINRTVQITDNVLHHCLQMIKDKLEREEVRLLATPVRVSGNLLF